MRLSSLLPTIGVFTAAGAACAVAAVFSVRTVESVSREDVLAELRASGYDWAEVDTEGLQVYLIGTAPDEATRFEALSAAGRVVDAARVIDNMQVEETDAIEAPRFSIELLRNDAGISAIGLIPAESDRAALMEHFSNIAGGAEVTDLLDAADFPAPEGWEDSLDFATRVLEELPRSKISVEAGRVAVKAMTETPAARSKLEADLARRAPDDVQLALDITAPRPVISPFALRFRIDGDGARFDSCSADTEESRDQILRAAAEAGAEGQLSCTLGLGVPSSEWGEAAALAIAKLDKLGAGTVTFSNADVTLQAVQGTAQDRFDRIVGELENQLPEVFALTAVLPEPPQEDAAEGPKEFTATLSPEGEVQLRGVVPGAAARETTDSYARAAFGSESVFTATRIDDELPQGWAVRVLAGLESLAQLERGNVTVRPDSVAVSGVTGSTEASAVIASLLAEKLGEDGDFDIDVRYDERLDPLLGIPTPEECVAQINDMVAAQKINFEPGSATLDASAKEVLDDIATLLNTCGEIPLEIGGHTDSQGREVMNQQLSQDRAQAVLEALQMRQVLVAPFTVTGYGESTPIADNGTAAGREENRRIEFRLLETEEDADEAGDAEAGDEATADDASADEDAAAQDAAAEDTPEDAETADDGDAPAEDGPVEGTEDEQN